MGVLRSFSSAIFIGDKQWALRRRALFVSLVTMLAGIINSIFFDPVMEHASLVLRECKDGLLVVLGLYVTGVVADDHLKRQTEQKAAQP
jgi:hypothetical protein